MEEIGVKLQKAVLIMMSIVSMLGMSSCENRLDSPCPSTGEGKAVEVSLCVGIADEVDAVSLAGGTSGTKAGEGVGSGSGLNVRLQSSAKTKAAVEDPLAPPSRISFTAWRSGNTMRAVILKPAKE